MKSIHIAAALALAGATFASAVSPSLARLPAGHRLLVVSAPAHSAELTAQRQALETWRTQARERDVTTIYLDGSKAEGASEPADTIRARYGIPGNAFAVALVGKDGHVAYRSPRVVSGEPLEKTIDAMPMRRAGQR